MSAGQAVLLGLCVLVGCTEEEAPAPKEVAKETLKPAWKKIETPVPVGKKVPCSALLNAEQASAEVGRQLEVKDESGRDPEATAVCRLMTVGKPPSEKQQERMLARTQALGLLPGDELCQVSVYCWSMYTVADLKKKCEDKKEAISTEIGALGCIQEVKAGDKQRYNMTILDDDTRCKLVIHSGPGVTDLPTTKTCAKVAVSQITTDDLKQAP
jgi:hypothetical protein